MLGVTSALFSFDLVKIMSNFPQYKQKNEQQTTSTQLLISPRDITTKKTQRQMTELYKS